MGYKMSLRRKLAIATWAAPREGNIYGKMELSATALVKYLEQLRQRLGQRVTVTHAVGKAVALALSQAPWLNGYLRFGRYIPHKTVDISFLVVLEGGQNLAKVKISRADTLSMVELARQLEEGVSRLRRGEDEVFKKSMAPLRFLPVWAIRPLLSFTGWLTGSLGVRAPALGLEAFPFGAAIITSVGMLGIDEGYVPPTPFARVPVYVLVGTLRDKPWVEEGTLTLHPTLTLTATLDHRFVDGYQAAVLANVVRQVLLRPELLEATGQELAAHFHRQTV
ncbi:MAG: 2-oxo acid dehydrogenase subunit E2 [Bacteroidia bacterium]